MSRFMSNVDVFLTSRIICDKCKKEFNKLLEGEVEDVVLCDKCAKSLKEVKGCVTK